MPVYVEAYRRWFLDSEFVDAPSEFGCQVEQTLIRGRLRSGLAEPGHRAVHHILL